MALNIGRSAATDLKKRFVVSSLLALGIFLLLLLRLWYLQVINHEEYRVLSEKNRTRFIPITAPRGPIYDRNGVVLVDNRPAFDIAVLRQEVEDPESLLSSLTAYLDVDLESLRKRWAAGNRFPAYRPVPLADDVSRETLEKVLEHSFELPGVLTEIRPLRSYPHGDQAAHILGYLGEITEEELDSGKFQDYRPGHFVGKSGLEKQLEKYLKGTDGERRVEVDVQGKKLRILKTLEPSPGQRVLLTIRQDLQQAAEEAFGEEAGAAVVMDVRTGEVLAMASRPSFDPALFARGITGQEWIDLLQNPRNPLTNKAIKGQYPPGSVFKIVSALAALESGAADPSTKVLCGGQVAVGNRTFRCWKKGGHGTVDLKKALKESCDVWFYQAGQKAGIEAIAAMSRNLGLGHELKFDLEGEQDGLIPDRQWKKQRFGQPWYNGETVIAAIGQGYILVTPMQMAAMMSAIANGGTVWRPHLVKRIQDVHGNIQFETKPERLHSVELNPAHLKAVREGLAAVVNEQGGTAWLARLQEMPYAGKTGTAQVVKQKERTRKGEEHLIPYQFRDHALFAAYAPLDRPEVAIAVIVEHGSHGSSAAAPIAQAILARYFNLEIEKKPVPAPPVPQKPAPSAAESGPETSAPASSGEPEDVLPAEPSAAAETPTADSLSGD
ncbi:MAG: penicillin-binding protein 2 [Syntrophotaleaceae bacterium]